MNQYGESDPTDQSGPVEGQLPPAVAPTWQWIGTPNPESTSFPSYGGYLPAPMAPVPPETRRAGPTGPRATPATPDRRQD